MTGSIVDRLPAARSGELTIYVFGPRPGESIGGALPDGDWVLVDSCMQDGHNLALSLLQRLGVAQVALAVLTHPDADHYRGFADVLATLECDRVWTFPNLVDRRRLLASMARLDAADGRWAALSEALGAIEVRMAKNRAEPVRALKSRGMGDATIHCVAPCPADMVHESRALEPLLRRVADGKPITGADGQLLRGQKLDGSGNGLSLALVIEWRGRRFCLGGSAEAPHDADRGWNGMMSYVGAEGRDDLLRDLALIKIAHHASDGAFCAAVFDLHASGGRPVGIATPFAGGKNPPPHAKTLQELRRRCSRLGITAEPSAGWSVVAEAGWSVVEETDGEGASCIVAVCDGDGGVELTRWGQGRTFV